MIRASRAIFLAALLGVGACGDKVDPEAEAAKLKNDLAEADARLKNYKIKDAERIYLMILEKYPNHPDAEFGMAKVRFNEYKTCINKSEEGCPVMLDTTQALLERVAGTLADNPKVHAMLGNVYHVKEDHPAASASYGKAFELEPDNSDYGLSVGIALKNSQKYPEAEQILRKVAELDPMVRFVYTELGDSVRLQNRLDEALKIYMKAQNTYASDKMARAGAAFVYEAKNDLHHAIDEWSAYIRMDCCSAYSDKVAKKKIVELQEKAGKQYGEGDGAPPAEGEQPAAPAAGAAAAAPAAPAGAPPAGEQPAAPPAQAG